MTLAMPDVTAAAPAPDGSFLAGYRPPARLRRAAAARRRAAPALGVPAPRPRGARRRRVRPALARRPAPDPRERRHLQRLRRPAAASSARGRSTPFPLLITSAEWQRDRAGARAARRAARPHAGRSLRPAAAASAAACCRRSWSSRTPASCGRATACRAPRGASACRSTPPTWRARPTGSWWVLADRTQAPVRRRLRAREPHRAVARAARAVPRLPRAAAAARSSARCARRSPRLAPRRDDEPAHRAAHARAVQRDLLRARLPGRYLGYTLVEGGDLTVRDERVCLQTLERAAAGRRDPAPRRRRLLRSARAARRLAARRARPGAGGAPGQRGDRQRARQRRGRERRRSWRSCRGWPRSCSARISRCRRRDLVVRRADGRAPTSSSNLEQLVVKPIFPHGGSSTVFGGGLDRGGARALAARDPRQAASVRRPGAGRAVDRAALVDGPPRAAAMVLRAFLAADGRRLHGHARRPQPRRAGARQPVVSSQRGGVSKDIWVLAAEPERELSLLVADATAAAARARRPGRAGPRRRQPVLARPLRRARRERRARAARGAAPRARPTRRRTTPHLPALLRAVTGHRDLPRLRRQRRRRAPRRARRRELLRAALRRAPHRQRALQPRARWCAPARAVRDRFSTDTWRVINALDRELAEPHDARRGARPARPHPAPARRLRRTQRREHEPRPGLALPRDRPPPRAGAHRGDAAARALPAGHRRTRGAVGGAAGDRRRVRSPIGAATARPPMPAPCSTCCSTTRPIRAPCCTSSSSSMRCSTAWRARAARRRAAGRARSWCATRCDALGHARGAPTRRRSRRIERRPRRMLARLRRCSARCPISSTARYFSRRPDQQQLGARGMKYRIVAPARGTPTASRSCCATTRRTCSPARPPRQTCRASARRHRARGRRERAEREDYFGNRVLYFAVQEPHEALTVTATSEVEVGAAAARDIGRVAAVGRGRATRCADGPTPTRGSARQFVLDSPLAAAAPDLSRLRRRRRSRRGGRCSARVRRPQPPHPSRVHLRPGESPPWPRRSPRCWRSAAACARTSPTWRSPACARSGCRRAT